MHQRTFLYNRTDEQQEDFTMAFLTSTFGLLLLFSTTTHVGVCATTTTVPTTFESLGEPREWRMSSSKKGSFKLAVRRWPAKDNARATVVLQHGGGFHSGYFGLLGEALARENFEVVAMDSVGAGYSEGEVEHLNVWREDLGRLVAEQTRPVILLVESMGAATGIPLALEDEGLVDALVVCGGLFRMTRATSPPAFVVTALVAIGAIFPSLTVTLASLNETFDSAFGDPRWATAARADPRIQVQTFHVGTASQVFRELPTLRRSAHKLKCPLLLVHSNADTRTDVDAAVNFFHDAVHSKSKHLVLYDDASHQLFQDSLPNINRAIADILRWLDGQFPPKSAAAGVVASESESEEEKKEASSGPTASTAAATEKGEL
mmetsp:Transcript_33485/g.106932  ORF Transcript_33485/g.106932 Transcript_33485/m.106932 type:complete len:376 (-) Transcript_33485:126-1253(-)